MLSVPGIYENGQVKLLEALPNLRPTRVIVTVLDDAQALTPVTTTPTTWLGVLQVTAQIVGDIVSPLDETGAAWEVLGA